jgi:glycosyltransferase involved in cell wall biosynthesis
MLNQRYPNLEYIIIDGGSTDGSVDIIRKYERHLAYWVSEKDEGQSDAIMKGFGRCTGELFAWVNSDDVLLPGCLEKVACAYLDQDKPDLIHTNVCYIDSQGRITRFSRVPRQGQFLFWRGTWHVVAPTLFYKSSLFHAVGGVNKAYHLSMDLDLWMKMMKAGARVAHLPCYLGGYRWHSSSKTAISLATRNTRENAEASLIYKTMLPRLSLTRRLFWRKCYKAWQVMNLNYFRAYWDLLVLGKNRRWQGAFRFSPTNE